MLDDSGAYGVGIADSFQKQAEKDGIKVLGRDQLNPKEADYTTILTKIKGLKPDALYYGGVAQAGVKLAKQAYDVIPNMIKGGGDGIQGGSFLKGGGFPAVEGWYSTNAGPHLTEDPAAAAFVKTFSDKYKDTPDDYSITAYDAALVVLDAIKRVADERQGGQSRECARCDADQQPEDPPGRRLLRRERRHQGPHGQRLPDTSTTPNHPDDDLTHQNPYIGVAPQS